MTRKTEAWYNDGDISPNDYDPPERTNAPKSDEERQKLNDEFEASIQERIKWEEEHPPQQGWAGIEINHHEIPW